MTLASHDGGWKWRMRWPGLLPRQHAHLPSTVTKSAIFIQRVIKILLHTYDQRRPKAISAGLKIFACSLIISVVLVDGIDCFESS